MKFSKIICLLFTLVVLSCGNDDEGNQPMTHQGVDITPTSTIDIAAVLALPPNSDITNLITFGTDPSVSASDYTTEVELLDTFNLVAPQQGLAPGDEFLFSDIIILDEFNVPIEADPDTLILENGLLQLVLPEGVTGVSAQDYYDGTMVPAVSFDIIDNEDSDIEWKYDIECYVRRGMDEFGPYIIDPKLRLKGRNTIN